MKKQTLAVFALIPLLSISACGSSDSDGDVTSPPSSTSDAPKTPEPTEETPTEDTPTEDAPASPASEIAVNQTLTDPEFNNTVEVQSYIPDFKLPADVVSKFAAFDGSKVVLVKVKVTAGKEYYGTMGPGDLRLVKTSDDIDIVPTNSLPEINAAVEAAGYAPVLKDVKTGETGEGWVIFNVRSEEPTLTLALHRLAFKVIGSDKEIPEQDFELALPAS